MTDFDQIKDDIKNRISITELISHYVSLKQNGTNAVGLCPFHNEKTPSFNVSDDKGIFKCFGCGKAGDIFTFLMEKENYTFPEAMKHLASMAGIEVEPQGKMTPAQRKKLEYYDLYKRLASSFCNILLNKPEAKQALEYLKSRNLTVESIQTYQLGYLPDRGDWLWKFLKKRNYSDEFLSESGLFSKKSTKFSLFTGRLVFPIFDRSGRVIAFSGRQMKDFGPKYINSPDTLIFHKSDSLFGIQKAAAEIRRNASVFLVEGNFDVLSMHQSGILHCVAPLGTSFTEAQAKQLTPHAKKAYCLFDSDAAGLKAAEKATLLLMQQGISSHIIELPEGTDPSDILKKEGEEALQKISKYSINSFDYLLNKAVKQYGIDNIDNKEQVIRRMLPFIQLFDTEIRKNDALRTLSEVIGIDFVSLQKDLAGNHFRVRQQKVRKEAERPEVKLRLPDGELLLLVTASLKIEYFKSVRSEFSLNDFRQPAARELFVAMEDCYRHEKFNGEQIINEIETEAYRELVAGWIQDSSFIQDPERTFRDTTAKLRIVSLQNKKRELMGQMNSQNYSSSVDNEVMSNLLEEIQFLNGEINRLKGEV